MKVGVNATTPEIDDREIQKSDLLVPYLKDVEGIDDEGNVTGR